MRYPFAYNAPNFYAEDGTVFTKNILEKGPVIAVGTLFNGYLVIGQYLLADLAVGISYIFGNGFVTIPKGIAIVSYLFWGLVCTLPFLLFRKQLGTLVSILTAFLLAITPLGGYDYAVIGTIGNLKFAFFFIATLLILYRNQNIFNKKWKVIAVDIALLVCVFTNILALALLPFGLWKYRKSIRLFFTNIRAFLQKISFDIVSFAALALISLIYVIVVYKLGIPSMPGYLDTPLHEDALVDVGYRGSIYGLLFPLNILINDVIAVILMAAAITFASLNKKRLVLWFFIFAVFINVFGFVINRPGVTEFFQAYTIDGGPGHFFYAGTMIFIFACAYSLKDWFRRRRLSIQLIIAGFVLLFVAATFPFSGSRGLSYPNIISQRPTIGTEIDRLCSANHTGESVILNVYPSEGWVFNIPKDIACSK